MVAIGRREIEMIGALKEVAGVTVIDADALELWSATLVAVILAEVVVLTGGAVKRPLLEIVPTVADQVTAALVPPLVAANCARPVEDTLVVAGEMVITALPWLEGVGSTWMLAPLVLDVPALSVALMEN